MNEQQIILLSILFVLLLMLVWGRYRYDIVALGALFVAALFGLIPQGELFSGFGNPATVTVVIVLIASSGLTKSGAVDFVAKFIEPLSSQPYLHIATLTFLAAALSMFMNNVGALALLMPIAIQSTAKAGRSPATVLMPLSFGSILGGLVTMIGTPPNILIANYREEVTGEPFAMFDFSPAGSLIALGGIIFMLLFGWRLVKVRKKATGLEAFEVEEYLFELRVCEETDFLGEKVGELRKLLGKDNIDLISMIRKQQKMPVVHRYQVVELNDLVILQGSHEEVDQFAAEHHLQMLSAENAKQEILHSEGSCASEVVVTANSNIVGRTPSQIRFNRKYDINLLAASRSGTTHRNRLRNMEIKVGDVLLLHGGEDAIADAIVNMDCYPLAKRDLAFSKGKKAIPALLSFFVAIAAAAAGIVPIQLALGIVTIVMAVLNIVPVREFYDAVDWPIVILLGAMIPLGAALETTGTTMLLVEVILEITGNLSPLIVLVVLLTVTMTVSDVLNNAATAILMAPIAYNIALALNVNPDTFLMAIAIGASCAFLTPIGHQNNALIMGPGGYKFGDYWRMGLPLEIIIIAVAVPSLLFFWPL